MLPSTSSLRLPLPVARSLPSSLSLSPSPLFSIPSRQFLIGRFLSCLSCRQACCAPGDYAGRHPSSETLWAPRSDRPTATPLRRRCHDLDEVRSIPHLSLFKQERKDTVADEQKRGFRSLLPRSLGIERTAVIRCDRVRNPESLE